MKKLNLIKSLFIPILFTSSICAQIPDLGTAAHFVLFTQVGAVGNTGISNINGDVGSDAGAITGFEDISGTIYNADAATEQAAIDVMSAYWQLFNTTTTSSTHTPAFGSGETLLGGVYAIAGAASVAGDLTLDANGDPNMLFIFKTGGALTTAASTTIHLINGASASNIFWIAEGAISMAALTNISGTFISHNGAVDMGDGSTLVGRLLSTAGAVSVYGTHASLPPLALLGLGLLSFSGLCINGDVLLKWTTATASQNEFTIQGSSEGLSWVNIGNKQNVAAESEENTYVVKDEPLSGNFSYYRIFETLLSGKKEYGNIIYVPSCAGTNNKKLIIYPNPSNGYINLELAENSNKALSTIIYNSQGELVFRSQGVPASINLSHLPPGNYFVHIRSLSLIINTKIVLHQK